MKRIRASRAIGRGVAMASIAALLGSAVGCVTLADPKRANFGQLIGVVQEPRSELLRISTNNRGTVEVATDRRTSYSKWITHQPWTNDKVVTADSVTMGRCVKVTTNEQNIHLAKRIEVSLDRAGAVTDPCREFR